MSSSLQTHLTILKDSSERFCDLPAFKIPSEDSTSNGIPRWEIITFKQFYDDVELCAKYWAHELGTKIALKSVVGLWYVSSVRLMSLAEHILLLGLEVSRTPI